MMADYTFRWNGAALLAAKNAAEQDALNKLADDIAAYLAENLHRYPGHTVHLLAGESFADVDERGDNREVVFGSDAWFTIFHELFATNYTPHPQIREAGDKFGRELGPRVVAALQARLR